MPENVVECHVKISKIFLGNFQKPIKSLLKPLGTLLARCNAQSPKQIIFLQKLININLYNKKILFLKLIM